VSRHPVERCGDDHKQIFKRRLMRNGMNEILMMDTYLDVMEGWNLINGTEKERCG
jgi:hypothetical protein